MTPHSTAIVKEETGSRPVAGASPPYLQDARGDQRLHRDGHAKQRHYARGSERQPAGHHRAIPLKFGHETMRIHHQDADGV